MHIRLPDMCKLVTIVNLRATSCALTHERVALGREPVRDADDLSAIKNFNLATLNNKQKKQANLPRVVFLCGSRPTGPEAVMLHYVAHRRHRAAHVSGARAVGRLPWCKQVTGGEVHTEGRKEKCGPLVTKPFGTRLTSTWLYFNALLRVSTLGSKIYLLKMLSASQETS